MYPPRRLLWSSLPGLRGFPVLDKFFKVRKKLDIFR